MQAAAALPLTDPYAIFARARQYWASARYPQELAYGVAIAVTRHGVRSQAHYHSYYDVASSRVTVVAVSDEELASPYTPRGIRTQFNILFPRLSLVRPTPPPPGTFNDPCATAACLPPPLLRIPLSAPERTFDFLGVPMLSPNYSFGIANSVGFVTATNDSQSLIQEIRRQFNDSSKLPTPAPSPDDSNLQTIANVEVARRLYVISLKGIVPFNGHDDYDLALRPVTDPHRYRLRELWIDTQSFATDQLISQGNFVSGGMSGIPWTVTFTQNGGTPYIASESTSTRFRLARHTYDSATVSFEQIAPAQIPTWMSISTFTVNHDNGMPPLVEP